MWTVFDAFPNTSFHRNRGSLENVLGITGSVEDADPTELEPPFVAIERDLVTHAPFGERPEDEDQRFDGNRAYFSERRSRSTIVSEYEHASERAVERLEQRMATLRERGLLDDTLVIFTADHGEILGEYGLMTHGSHVCPELVRVPTIFCTDEVTLDEQVISQADIVPTALSLAGRGGSTPVDISGLDLTENADRGRLMFAESRGIGYRHEWSAWDAEGGYIFTEDTVVDRLKWFYRQLGPSCSAPYSRHNLLEFLPVVFEGILEGHRRVGNPNFDKAQAESFCADVFAGEVNEQRREITDEGRERLERLGYLDEL
ncbi:sulfatase-like hydrolase/transferase [Halogeometricum borinquense]|uniref:sulfatase-like hydrolase/transferase n=1 Tax=Halogeometricum borinquense TaxID=60847 RepID=UPI0013ED283F|nr:sulfatase-like hydrolase/transferase [Halogeometricum borinquense]